MDRHGLSWFDMLWIIAMFLVIVWAHDEQEASLKRAEANQQVIREKLDILLSQANIAPDAACWPAEVNP